MAAHLNNILPTFSQRLLLQMLNKMRHNSDPHSFLPSNSYHNQSINTENQITMLVAVRLNYFANLTNTLLNTY